MTTKRNKGLLSLDHVIHASYNYRTEPKLSNDTEAIRTNPDNRLTKDDIASIFSGSLNTNDPTKLATSARPTVELLRANSPTLKRLLAARAKLEKYISLKLNFDLLSHRSIDGSTETISTLNREKSIISNIDKSTTANVRISSSAHKRIKSQKTFSSLPIDKITYEKAPVHTGKARQKCSLEIWLPKAGADDDEDTEDEVAHRIAALTTSSSSPPPLITSSNKVMWKKSQSPQPPPLRSRRSSIIKTASTTIAINTTNVETKSIDDTSSKKSEPILIPRVYHYEDYLIDPIEERPRSSKSSNTSKSDCKTLNKIIKRHRARQQARRMSTSTNHTDETIQSVASEKPMTSKNLLANIKLTSIANEQKNSIGPNNTLMINELMQKYSMIKRTHQELIQAKLQLEKPRIEPKHNTQVPKDNSLGSPLTSDSASYTSSDYLTVSVKKLLNENSPPRSAGIFNNNNNNNNNNNKNNNDNNNNNNNNNNTKLLDRRSAYSKTSNSDILPQTRLISIVKHFHNRQTSANTSAHILPAVIGKKTDDSIHSLERSKTLHVMFDIPTNNSAKAPSNLPARPDSPDDASVSSNLTQKINSFELIPPCISKRSVPPPARLTIHSEEQQQKQQNTQSLLQLVQYQNIQSSAQRYHHSTHSSSATTDISTNKALAHLKYSNGGNTDRNCLLPE